MNKNSVAKAALIIAGATALNSGTDVFDRLSNGSTPNKYNDADAKKKARLEIKNRRRVANGLPPLTDYSQV